MQNCSYKKSTKRGRPPNVACMVSNDEPLGPASRKYQRSAFIEHIKSVVFEIHSNKFYPKKANILFVIKFKRNF
jgi:hypothetical protein